MFKQLDAIEIVKKFFQEDDRVKQNQKLVFDAIQKEEKTDSVNKFLEESKCEKRPTSQESENMEKYTQSHSRF